MRFLVVDKLLQKSLLRLDLYDFEPQIATEKYTTSIHLNE
jgi:hypothetical protein